MFDVIFIFSSSDSKFWRVIFQKYIQWMENIIRINNVICYLPSEPSREIE